MRKILFFLVILIIAVFIGLAIAKTPSFVLFQIKDISLAMPLWLFILLIALLIYISLLLQKILRTLFIIPQKLKSNLAAMHQRHEVKRQMRAIHRKISKTKV